MLTFLALISAYSLNLGGYYLVYFWSDAATSSEGHIDK